MNFRRRSKVFQKGKIGVSFDRSDTRHNESSRVFRRFEGFEHFDLPSFVRQIDMLLRQSAVLTVPWSLVCHGCTGYRSPFCRCCATLK